MQNNRNKNEILQEVISLESKCGSIIDAVIQVCEKYSIEVETIAHYIKYTKDIKERIRVEGTSLKMITET
jgi:hypothetical protein